MEENGWRRNTKPLNLIDGDEQYPYLYIPNKLKQTGKVQGTSPGTISSVGILTGGTNYRVDDKLVFDNTDTNGSNVSARVSKVGGREVNSVSVASTTVEGLEIFPNSDSEYVLYAATPHNLTDQDAIISLVYQQLQFKLKVMVRLVFHQTDCLLQALERQQLQ